MGLLQHWWSRWCLVSRSLKIFVAVLVLVVLVITIHPLWFYPQGLLTDGDWTPLVDPSVSIFVKSLATWGAENLGQANIQVSSLPFLSVWGWLFSLGFSFAVIEKVTFFVPTGLLLVLAPFFLSLRLHRRIDVAFIVALFYSTTSGYGLGAVPPIHFVYALAPLLLLLLIRALDKNLFADWLLLGIVYSLAISYELRIAYIVLFLLVFYTIFLAPRPFREYRKPWIGLFVIGILLNAYWWLPLLFLRFQTSLFFERGLFGTAFFDVSHAFTIVHFSWMPQGYSPGFFLIPVPWYLWAVPFIAFSTLLYRKQTYRRPVLFFAMLALLGIFLSKEIASPLPYVYQWLYDNIPGFVFFREASKFFLFTSLAYAVLIGYALIMFLERFRGRIARVLYVGALFVFLGIAGWHMTNFFNPQSFGNGEAKWMPEDYRLFNQYLVDNTDRNDQILWIPRSPRWGISPRVDIVALLEGRWRFMASSDVSLSKRAIAFVQQPYFQKVLHDSGIRYVGVPIHDVASNDDFMSQYENRQLFIDALDALPFLKRIELPTTELVVYENIQPIASYVSASDEMFRFSSADNLVAKYEFLRNLNEPFEFYVSDSDHLAARFLVGLFEKFQFDKDVLSSSLGSQPAPSFITSHVTNSSLHVRSDSQGTFSVTQEPVEHLTISNEDSSVPLETYTLLNSDDLSDDHYYLDVAGSLQSLGDAVVDKVMDAAKLPVFLLRASEDNLIANPSFEEGLWDPEVGDCHNYDDDPAIGMSLVDTDKTDGVRGLRLWAQRHIACTARIGIPITEGRDYIFQFDYRGDEASHAAYYMAFTGASAPNDVVKHFIPILDNNWHRYTEVFTPPQGTTAMTLHIYSSPMDTGEAAVNYYDNFAIHEILQKEDITSSLPSVAPIDRYLKEGQAYAFQLQEQNSSSKNLIANPSFEDGLWNPEVGDCHNYDDDPAIGMSLSPHARDGKHSLELWAQRHIACTGQNGIAIQPGREYLLRFDYQGDEAGQAGYYVGFDSGNPLQTRITISDTAWHTYTTRFVAPAGSESASFILYSYGSETNAKAINRYDNVELRLLPPFHETYNLIASARSKLQVPRALTFERQKNTNVFIDVRGAKQPFWLKFNEGYDPGWRLNPVRPSVQNLWNTWLPSSGIPFLADDAHVSFNNYLNGWYVDVPRICAQPGVCRMNADGTYDIDMVAEYWPQRWLRLGVLVSGLVLFISLVWLTFAWMLRRKKSIV